MKRQSRDAPLPAEMQGRWIDQNDAASELVIADSEITCFGRIVAHDYKEVGWVDGVLCVNLGVEDATQEDTFQRTNVTGLALIPDGTLNAYNMKFAEQFVRPAG